jgi:uncharacterized YccA/Bax inhibitor family protein
MRTSNPMLAGDVFANWADADRRATVMTVEGTALKALILLAIAVATAAVSWSYAATAGLGLPVLLGGALGGFILAMITAFKPTWSPVTAPLYAAAEGLFLGAISMVINQRYGGIVVNAVALTFGVMFLMLLLYTTRLIRVTQWLRTMIMVGTGAIALLYLVSFVLSFFGVMVPFIHSSGPIGIAFSVFVVGLAAFNLLLDFDAIERGAQAEAPKYMEWYGAFGLMVTLVWLYLEILRLLSKLNRR